MSKRLLFAFLIMTLVVAGLSSVVTASDEPVATSAFPWLTECSEDLTGQTVTFYHFGDISARYAPITTPLVAGFNDAATYMNANGGLCGATIVQENQDTANEVERAQSAWDEYAAREDAHVIFIYNSNDGELLREQAAEQEIVLFNAAGSERALYGDDGNTPGWQYSFIPLYTDQLGAFCDFIADPANRETVGLTGDPVIGYMSWPDAFGTAADTPETRAYCEAAGVGFAAESQLFLPDAADLSPLISNLTDQGANIIYTNTLATGPANIAKTVASMGLGDQLLVAGPNWVLDTSVIFLGGVDSFGIVGNLPYAWWDELDNPGVQIVTGVWDQTHMATATDEAGQRAALGLRNIAYLNAWGSLDMWAEAMIRTINRVGFENLSGAAVYETLQDFEYEPLMGVMQVHFTADQRAGEMTRIGMIQLVESDGAATPAILPLTDWMPAPDLRAGAGGGDAGGEVEATAEPGS